jgi:hypothetical protein
MDNLDCLPHDCLRVREGTGYLSQLPVSILFDSREVEHIQSSFLLVLEPSAAIHLQRRFLKIQD